MDFSKTKYYYGKTQIKLIFDKELGVLDCVECIFPESITTSDVEATFRKRFGNAFSSKTTVGEVERAARRPNIDESLGLTFAAIADPTITPETAMITEFSRTDVLRMSDGELWAKLDSFYKYRTSETFAVYQPEKMKLAELTLYLSSVRFNAAKDERKKKADEAERQKKAKEIEKVLDF